VGSQGDEPRLASVEHRRARGTFKSRGEFVKKCRAAPPLSAIPVEDREVTAYSVAAKGLILRRSLDES
jgi:hypothetical protein